MARDDGQPLGNLPPANPTANNVNIDPPRLPRSTDSKVSGGVSELTLLTPIIPGPIPGECRTYEQRLRQELSSIEQRLEQSVPTVIGSISVIHMAGWQILRPEQYLRLRPPDTPGNGKYYSWLLFTACFDGDMRSYLREFSVFIGDGVDRIWGSCEGYPVEGSRDFERFWDYAKRHQLPKDAFFNGYPGLSVPRIYQLDLFKRRFDEFVARTRGPDGRTVENVAELLDAFLRENSAYPQNFPSQGGLFPKSGRL
jgi:hypothetical protein